MRSTHSGVPSADPCDVLGEAREQPSTGPSCVRPVQTPPPPAWGPGVHHSHRGKRSLSLVNIILLMQKRIFKHCFEMIHNFTVSVSFPYSGTSALPRPVWNTFGRFCKIQSSGDLPPLALNTLLRECFPRRRTGMNAMCCSAVAPSRFLLPSCPPAFPGLSLLLRPQCSPHSGTHCCR